VSAHDLVPADAKLQDVPHRRSREAPLFRKILALVGLFVALTTAAAVAQEEPTYEGRGYGGPRKSVRS